MDATERRLAQRRAKEPKPQFKRGRRYQTVNADAVRRVDKGDTIYYAFSREGKVVLIVRMR